MVLARCMSKLNFIGMGFEDRESSVNYKMKNSCPQWDSNMFPSAYEATALTIALRDLISIEHLKVYRISPECAIKTYHNHVVDVVKCLS